MGQGKPVDGKEGAAPDSSVLYPIHINCYSTCANLSGQMKLPCTFVIKRHKQFPRIVGRYINAILINSNNLIGT